MRIIIDGHTEMRAVDGHESTFIGRSGCDFDLDWRLFSVASVIATIGAGICTVFAG